MSLLRLALVVPVLLSAGIVRAEAPPSALTQSERTARSKAHYNLGRAHLDLHEYDQAMTEFERGYEYKPMPLFLYNIGQVARMSGQREKALEYFQRYLQAEPRAPERPTVERHIAELKETLAHERKPEPPVKPEVATTPVPTPVEPTPAPELTPAAAAVTATVPAPAEPPRKSRKKLWIALGVVGAVLVLGGVTAAIVINTTSNNDSPPVPPGFSYWGSVDVRQQP